MRYNEIEKCRVCKGSNLETIIDIGLFYPTSFFPRDKNVSMEKEPLQLALCMECGLVQLNHSFETETLYGSNYGYRSGLNQSMVKHLEEITLHARSLVNLQKGELVLDIGSNDGTLLKNFTDESLNLCGIDPTGKKFANYYSPEVNLIPNFFSRDLIKAEYGEKKAKIITSIAMFYDLEDPIEFASGICDVLDDEGVWIFEQSYFPSMLDANSYDTICQEHLEYYSLSQIDWILSRVGLKICDIKLTSANGGSFMVTAAKNKSNVKVNSEKIGYFLSQEKSRKLDQVETYSEFNSNIQKHRDEVKQFISSVKASGKKMFGYGASTKGNVILQYCDLDSSDFPFILEVNEDKFGAHTPGTNIPIISEQEGRSQNPDYLFVLPWHFKENIIKREKEFLNSGGKLVFPLPKLEIIGKEAIS